MTDTNTNAEEPVDDRAGDPLRAALAGTMRLEVELDEANAARFALYAARRGLSVPKVVELALTLLRFDYDAPEATMSVRPIAPGDTEDTPGPEWALASLNDREVVAGTYSLGIRCWIAPGRQGLDLYSHDGLTKTPPSAPPTGAEQQTTEVTLRQLPPK